jgi:hypothetical protein
MAAWPAKYMLEKLADSGARSYRSPPPLAASGIRAGDGRKHIAAETVNAPVIFGCGLAVVRR